MAFPRDSEDFKEIDWQAILRVLPWFIVAVVLLVGAFTSFYTVPLGKVAVVLRFGKYKETVDRGLHFKIPFFIERHELVPGPSEQLKMEFGYRSTPSRSAYGYAKQSFDEESLMVTGDLNVADVEWVTQYKISNPRDFLFKVRNVTDTFRFMNEAVMREVIGDHTIDEVLTDGRIKIAQKAHDKLQVLSDTYQLGILISQVSLQDVNPPERVRPSFNKVNQAEQEKESRINSAEREKKKLVTEVDGQGKKIIAEANGYKNERVNRAQGDANAFLSVYEAYRLAPEVTRKRMFIETMETVQSKVGKKIIIDSKQNGLLPLLNLSQETK